MKVNESLITVMSHHRGSMSSPQMSFSSFLAAWIEQQSVIDHLAASEAHDRRKAQWTFLNVCQRDCPIIKLGERPSAINPRDMECFTE